MTKDPEPRTTYDEQIGKYRVLVDFGSGLFSDVTVRSTAKAAFFAFRASNYNTTVAK